MSQFPSAFPGFGPGSLTLTPYRVFAKPTDQRDFLAGGSIIDGAQARDPGNDIVSELRPGLLLAKVTSTNSGATTLPVVGTYAASIMGTITTALVIASSACTLTAASAVEVVRRIGATGTLILTGAPTATGVVAQSTGNVYTAVNTTTGVITFNSSVNTAFTAGAWVGANDGTSTPTTVLCGPGDSWVLKVTDINGTNMPNTPLPTISISTLPYDTTKIINYPAAANTTLIAKLKTYLRVSVPGATFTDDF